jgi:hypothetical protein
VKILVAPFAWSWHKINRFVALVRDSDHDSWIDGHREDHRDAVDFPVLKRWRR